MAGSGALALTSLRIHGFRNLQLATVSPDPSTNIVFGQNGQGKTSLLEAIYFVATTRSFRTSKVKECGAHGADEFHVKATFTETRGETPPFAREQVVSFAQRATAARLDGERPPSLAAYAVKSPVIVFHPDELALSSGPAALRRRLLDRVALYMIPIMAHELGRYARAAKARQELLKRGADETEVEAYETILASSGAAISQGRRRALEALLEPGLQAFRRIAAPDLELELVYRPAGSEEPERAMEELAARRDRDRRFAGATFGPHRDDIEISLNGHPSRVIASQGQHRAITLSLKAAESAAVTLATGLDPIQLLDDVSSELDPERTAALFDFLGTTRGQVFVTTTRPDLLTTVLNARNPKLFRLVKGAIETL